MLYGSTYHTGAFDGANSWQTPRQVSALRQSPRDQVPQTLLYQRSVMLGATLAEAGGPSANG